MMDDGRIHGEKTMEESEKKGRGTAGVFENADRPEQDNNHDNNHR